ncbi:hypothetical protein B0H15DRAFT_928705, partial [Mycena belliarum]
PLLPTPACQLVGAPRHLRHRSASRWLLLSSLSRPRRSPSLLAIDFDTAALTRHQALGTTRRLRHPVRTSFLGLQPPRRLRAKAIQGLCFNPQVWRNVGRTPAGLQL